jgi:UDP-N-acetylmuramoylalanine--D-glutamate ligase
MTLEMLATQGHHSMQGSMAAGIGTRIGESRKDFIRESFSEFLDIEHRLEKIANVHGIEFINDSKATNVNSTWFALESMTKPVIWIAGGVDTGNDFRFLCGSIRNCVKAIICLGLDNDNLISAIQETNVPFLTTQSMTEAVELAYLAGTKGDIVLLSPACASFDLFEDYEDRGNEFKKAVRNL